MSDPNVDLGQAAARYAAAGIPVFPIVPGQKRPLTEHGLYDASTDAAQVRHWWTLWPEANVAMPTGTTTWDVLDIDTKHDQPGLESLQSLRKAGLGLGWSRVVATPTGGLHLYFAGTDQRNSTIAGAGVDFRSTGGYVLLPPSRLILDGSLRTYRLLRTTTSRQSLDWSAVRQHLTPPVSDNPPRRPMDADPEQRMTPLVRHVEHAQEGNRNHALYWAAHRAIDNGAADLTPLVDAAVRAGLARTEAEGTVNSALTRRARHHPPSRSATSATGRGITRG